MKDLRLLLVAVAVTTSAYCAADWKTATVPGAWEETVPVAARNYDGIAWYRTWVKVPDDTFKEHERNLFEESVGISIQDLADVHEVYVNGIKIGAGGEVPPAFRSGIGAIHFHKVPVGTLRKAAWNEVPSGYIIGADRADFAARRLSS